MIEQQLLDQVVDLVKSRGLSEPLVAELRQQFTGVHFTLCMDDDMGSVRPMVEETDFNLYLVDSTNHCSTLTTNPEGASGIVLAEIIDDE